MLGFAKKIGMTRLFVNGQSIPVTAINYGQHVILQSKTVDKDGYNAIQVAAFPQKNPTKPLLGHIKKYKEDATTGYHCLEEFDGYTELETPNLEQFIIGDRIDITGTTKGKGFTGVMKRHGFHGQPASHGHDHKRAPGSIGSRWPQRVPAGKKMAGRSGGETCTIKKAEILAIDSENSLIFVRGSIPGANSNYLKIEKNNV